MKDFAVNLEFRDKNISSKYKFDGPIHVSRRE